MVKGKQQMSLSLHIGNVVQGEIIITADSLLVRCQGCNRKQPQVLKLFDTFVDARYLVFSMA